MDPGDEILRAYSLLSALKQDIPTQFEVEDRWVKEYHAAVDKIEKAIGLNLSDFKVSPHDIHRAIVGGNYITKEVEYGDFLCCERSILMHKVDALLNYFTGLQAPKENRIGFRRPE